MHHSPTNGYHIQCQSMAWAIEGNASMTTTLENAELLALADEIKRSTGLSCMKPGLGNMELGIKKTAQVVAALCLAAKPSEEVREALKADDDRPIPTYGQIPWKQLGRDVVDAQFARRADYEFDPSYYPGHQMVPRLNFNSLARIVDKYRWHGIRALSITEAPKP